MALFIDKLTISSPDFAPVGPIPAKFSGYDQNRTPTLVFSGAPQGTLEIAVICHDPDAPLPNGFTHWTIYGIPANATSIDLGADGVRVGPNSMGESGWTGPMPPAGHGVHHYYFWVYALNVRVLGEPSREEFINTYEGAIIEQARVLGTFEV